MRIRTYGDDNNTWCISSYNTKPVTFSGQKANMSSQGNRQNPTVDPFRSNEEELEEDASGSFIIETYQNEARLE